MVFVVGVTRTVVKSGMLFVLGVSESFKDVWGVTEESGIDSLLGLAKDTLLLNTWVVPYSVLVLVSLTEYEFKYLWVFHLSKVHLSCLEGHPW